ncbi:transcription elongation factor [Ramicandelaber brevisporus]|nr:transcription elongation factor [Ramicandelaber brevisporus]
MLRKTNVGMSVGKLRAHADKTIVAEAKATVAKWKQDVSDAKQTSAAAKTMLSKPGSNGASSSLSSSAPNGKPTDSPSPVAAKTPERTAESDGISIDSTGNTKRDNCIKMIYNSLALDSSSESRLILSRATDIEEICFKQHKNPSNAADLSKYTARIRSLYLNLKDKSNPSLRAAVVSGDLTTERFCSLSTADMASEERKQADKTMEEENLRKARVAAPEPVMSSTHQCGKCKKRQCSFIQIQIRSADEPMTTFVTCHNCGNKWKYN